MLSASFDPQIRINATDSLLHGPLGNLTIQLAGTCSSLAGRCCRNLICQPHAKRGCGPEVSTMCPSAIFGPLSLTTLGSPVCWKVTAVTAAAQPRAALLFSFAKPISMLLGAPRTDSTTLLASFLSEARTRTNARSFTSNEYSFMTSLQRRFVSATNLMNKL